MMDFMQQKCDDRGEDSPSVKSTPSLHQGIFRQKYQDNGATILCGAFDNNHVNLRYPGVLKHRHGRGLSVTGTNTSDRVWLLRQNTPNFAGTVNAGQCTVICRYAPQDTNNEQACIWGANTTGGDASGLCGPRYSSSGNTLRWDWGGTSNGSTSLQVLGPLITDGIDVVNGNIYTMTVGPRGMEYFIDHYMWGSNSATPNIIPTNQAINLFYYNGVDGKSGTIFWWRMYSKQLTHGMIHDIVKDEYAPWRPWF